LSDAFQCIGKALTQFALNDKNIAIAMTKTEQEDSISELGTV